MTWNGSDRAARLPADWPQRRRRVLVRDRYRCRIDGPGCQVFANEVDHIIAGDDHRLGNLQAACTDCHRRKSAREGVAARKPRRRPSPRHPGLIKES